jgi:hypothetical protein
VVPETSYVPALATNRALLHSGQSEDSPAARFSSDQGLAAASSSNCAFKFTVQEREQRSRELAWMREVRCVSTRDFN